jgi:hypothetical protein
MVIKGSVAPRPMVSSSDEASSAIVERLRVGIIFSLPDKCYFFVVLFTNNMLFQACIAFPYDKRGIAALLKIMIYPNEDFSVTLISLIKIRVMAGTGYDT